MTKICFLIGGGCIPPLGIRLEMPCTPTKDTCLYLPWLGADNSTSFDVLYVSWYFKTPDQMIVVVSDSERECSEDAEKEEIENFVQELESAGWSKDGFDVEQEGVLSLL